MFDDAGNVRFGDARERTHPCAPTLFVEATPISNIDSHCSNARSNTDSHTAATPVSNTDSHTTAILAVQQRLSSTFCTFSVVLFCF